MDEHKKFLSDRLLGEERPVTYRLLSRALGVHVNTAKEMLYDFHKSQNALRADSVHATYLVYGTKSSDIAAADGDVEMASSMPDQDALSEDVTVTTLTLAREEELKDVLADYKKVTAIHVYSLAPFPQKDLSLLSDVATQLSEYSINEDASAAAKKYGTITNTQVRRRDRKGRSMATAPAAKPAKPEPTASKPTPTPTSKAKPNPFAPKPASVDTKPVKQEKVEPSSKDETPTSSAGKKPPALKKGNSGGIMQSFARAAALPPRPKPAPKKEEDTAMALSDDGEADDTDLPAKKTVSDPDAVRAARKQREEALRRMMDDEEDEEDAEASEKDDEPADEEMEEAPEPEPEPEPEAKKEEKEPAEVVSSAGDGRRRGKRRVMKKKRILDEQGYMVTIQEPGWESFSEDEAPPPAKKQAVTVTQTQSQSSTPSSSAGKGKKPAGKGQGNIMSFFAKK
ncbi:DNA polymerase subunit Cdc27 [Dactylonectria estremocensis]|uniref:DNA polymerase delta subunit 3 n=1 Tax=Dactylonectria estremocensis TaxID=1079267 RepID=A0A9P9FL08_9HYPO|nr:DNA polymerase subunit Cdc27 [Dactylonectria estremocensis]